jgi:hypothetical protein
MSKQRQDLPGDKLPLPQPRSPQELDDKILAYARQRAPQRNSRWIPGWTSGWTTGLATASIIAIAVFITQTQQSAPSFKEYAQPAAEQRHAEEAIRPMPAAPAPPAAARISSKASLVRKRAMKREILAEQVAPESFGAIAKEQFSDMELAADTAAMPKAAANEDGLARMEDQQLELQLEQCARLLEQGHADQAREAYQALRLECASCDLPDTLDLWLASQREDIAPWLPPLPMP